MNVLIFGATGMIGQGVLLECLRDRAVRSVVVVGRRATGSTHTKLREYVQPDVAALEPLAPELQAVDACFFCLGVSAVGMAEAQYTRLTHDLTLSVATKLAGIRRDMTFVYVSGMGTDSTERGRAMWARVKGRTENALLKLPFRAAYMFRPGLVQPVDGVRSATGWYRAGYLVLAPVLPLLRRILPGLVTTTAQIGRAMLVVARGDGDGRRGDGDGGRIIETRDIARLAASPR